MEITKHQLRRLIKEALEGYHYDKNTQMRKLYDNVIGVIELAASKHSPGDVRPEGKIFNNKVLSTEELANFGFKAYGKNSIDVIDQNILDGLVIKGLEVDLSGKKYSGGATEIGSTGQFWLQLDQYIPYDHKMKSTLIHEIEHIGTPAEAPDDDKYDIRTMIIYYNHSDYAETVTASKQYAYLFRKYLPEKNIIDVEDLLKLHKALPASITKKWNKIQMIYCYAKASQYHHRLKKSYWQIIKDVWKQYLSEGESEQAVIRELEEIGQRFISYINFFLKNVFKQQGHAGPLALVDAIRGNEIAKINISTKKNSRWAQNHFGDDAQYWDKQEQFKLELTESGWKIIHNPRAANKTTLNRQTITRPQILQNGDEIAVGNVEKGIFKTPMKVLFNDRN